MRSIRNETITNIIHRAERMLVVHLSNSITIHIEILKSDNVTDISKIILNLNIYASSDEIYKELATIYPNRDAVIIVNEGEIGSFIKYNK